MRALRSDVIMAQTTSRRTVPRLLTPPHRQRDRQFVAARLVATSKIGNGPSQLVDS
jgi:hypothetical protein